MKYIALLTCLLVLPLSANTEKKVLRISSIDWCPQLCPSGQNPGYIVDLLKLIFDDSPYQLSIETVPWSRAIKQTRIGDTYALLSPAKAEAPDLTYPEFEVGTQRMCFFVNKASSWKYQNPKSLEGLKIGIAIDTSIEELNEFVRRNPRALQYLPYNDSYIIKSLRKLDRKRIDTFLFTYNTTIYEMNKLDVAKKYKSVGCVSEANIYMALSPAPALASEVNKIKALFDQKMAKLRKTDQIDRVMRKYKLKSWLHHTKVK